MARTELSEGFVPILQKLRWSKSFHFKISLTSVFYPSKVPFQRFKLVVIKLKMWPKPKRAFCTDRNKLLPLSFPSLGAACRTVGVS